MRSATGPITVYMAGPLFTLAERSFNSDLRDLLKEHGAYEIFLPQESEVNARTERDEASIARDDFDLIRKSDVVLACLDGAMVDDGTALEVGIAIGCNIVTIGYRTDFRSRGDDPKNRMNAMFNLMDVIIFKPSIVQPREMEVSIALLAKDIHDAIVHNLAQRAH